MVMDKLLMRPNTADAVGVRMAKCRLFDYFVVLWLRVAVEPF